MTKEVTKNRKGGRFSRLPAAAVFDPNLTPGPLRVLAALGTYVDEEGVCWPSIATLASRLRISERAVQQHLRILEAAGYVTTNVQSRGIKNRVVNTFHLRYPEPPPPPDKGRKVKPSFTPSIEPTEVQLHSNTEIQLHPEQPSEKPINLVMNDEWIKKETEENNRFWKVRAAQRLASRAQRKHGQSSDAVECDRRGFTGGSNRNG